MNVIPLFSTPICVTDVDGNITASIKEKVVDLEYERLNSNSGWISKNKKLLNDPEFLELKTEIELKLNQFIRDQLNINPNITFYMTNSWAVKFDKGDYSISHVHINSLLSGVCYIQTGEDTGNIVFDRENNQQSVFPLAINIDYTSWNIFNSKSWKFQPKDNQLFFFPSNVQHGVSKNNNDNPRYSIAFNFFAKGDLSSNDMSELIL